MAAARKKKLSAVLFGTDGGAGMRLRTVGFRGNAMREKFGSLRAQFSNLS